ncbi:MAG: hypothetical protein HC771_22820 [Synechococcales cyanobacterium CRU_2_2]|nr:hypothetical protein [Synechococcales cyanobacterium CRU_2_2]
MKKPQTAQSVIEQVSAFDRTIAEIRSDVAEFSSQVDAVGRELDAIAKMFYEASGQGPQLTLPTTKAGGFSFHRDHLDEVPCSASPRGGTLQER